MTKDLAAYFTCVLYTVFVTDFYLPRVTFVVMQPHMVWQFLDLFDVLLKGLFGS